MDGVYLDRGFGWRLWMENGFGVRSRLQNVAGLLPRLQIATALVLWQVTDPAGFAFESACHRLGRLGKT
jgi:hypothetical protein